MSTPPRPPISDHIAQRAHEHWKMGWLTRIRWERSVLERNGEQVFAASMPSDDRASRYRLHFYADSGQMICSCPAGQHERSCWHVVLFGVFLGLWDIPQPPARTARPVAPRIDLATGAVVQ